MGAMRDFDPESMTDAVNALISFAEDVAKEALTSGRILNNFEKREIVLASAGIRPAADALVKFIKIFHLSPEAQNGHLVVLCKLMLDLITIFGGASMYTDDTQAQLLKMRAALMQMRKAVYTRERREEKIRPAILAVCQGTQLIGSTKFAESIHPAVCEKLGVKINARGYSARTFQRIIRTILEECREV